MAIFLTRRALLTKTTICKICKHDKKLAQYTAKTKECISCVIGSMTQKILIIE